MTASDIVALIITGSMGLALVVLSVFMLRGRGGGFIAGFNTMDEKEKAKYDEKALCRFMGKIILPIGVLTPLLTVAGMSGQFWFTWVYFVAVMGLVIFALVYVNTGNRFRK